MTAQNDDYKRPPHLAFPRGGIHDHHLRAARTDAERERAEREPWKCYDDERCWWDGGASDGR